MNRHARLLAIVLTGSVLTTAAWAQVTGGPLDDPMKVSGARANTYGDKKDAEPPALPGARSNQDKVAPSTKPALDMGPTEALFDAVNRGDIGAARDALSRGADLNEKNLLGLTALDLAVDLGRNDIAFLLLSLRGGPSPAAGPGPKTASSTTGRPAANGPAKIAAAKPAPTKPMPQKPMPTAAAQPVAAQRYATDGGAPIPNAGFLGFGGGH